MDLGNRIPLKNKGCWISWHLWKEIYYRFGQCHRIV